MSRTKIGQPQINQPATQVTTATSGSAASTGTAMTATYTFVAGQKYQIFICSSNANSTGIWQLSYSTGSGTQIGLNHGRFGGASSEQASYVFTNIYIPSSSGSQTITVTATLVTSGGANWDDMCVIVVPLVN